MTIRHLKIFIAVAQAGKMNLAAERLFLSQPTVSQAIRELEEHYHVLLFERLSKKLYITEAGKQLLVYARQTVEQFDILEERMLDADGLEHLRIGVTMTVGNCILPPLLSRFEETCPLTETYTCVDNTRAIEEQLLNAQLHVGIVEGNIKSPDLVSVPVVEDILVLACAADHPFAGRRSLTLGDLEGSRFVMRERGSGTRALFELYLSEKGLSVQTKIEAHCISMIRNAILQNGCLAVISVRLLEQEIRQGSVKVFYNKSGAWDRTFKLVYHKNKYITPSMEKLGELLKEYGRPQILDEASIGTLEETESSMDSGNWQCECADLQNTC